MLLPHGRIAEAARTGVGRDARVLLELSRLCHERDGLQYVKAADCARGDVNFRAALDGSLPGALVEFRVGKRADGNHHEVDARAQNLLRYGAHALHARGFDDVCRLERDQIVNRIAHGAAHGGGRLFGRFARTAVHAHKLVIRQQPHTIGVRDDIAQEAAAIDAKGRLHVILSIHSHLWDCVTLSIPYCVPKRKLDAGKARLF